MKKLLTFFLFSSMAIFGAEEKTKTPTEAKKIIKPPSSSTSHTTTTPHATIPHPAATKESAPSKGYLLIDVKQRAEDFVKALEILKKDKPSSRIFFKLEDGTTISNIMEIKPLSNGTLLLFKISTIQGIKTLVIMTENISELGHL